MIALIMPFHNSALTLPYTLDSIVRANREELYLVCIDNASTDNSLDIASAYIPRVLQGVILREDVKGVSAARNTGLSYVYQKRDIFSHMTFLDADDFLNENIDLRGVVDDLVVYSSEDLRVAVVGGVLNLDVVKQELYPAGSIGTSDPALICSYAKRPNRNSAFVTVWGKVYRVDPLCRERVLFNERMHTFEDVDFNFRVLTYITSVKFNPLVLIRHVIDNTRSGGTLSRSDPIRLFSFLWAMRSFRRYLRFIKYPNVNEYLHTTFAYFSIVLVRYGFSVRTYADFVGLLALLRKSARSPIIRRASLQYSSTVAKGSFWVHLLYRLNLRVPLALFAIFKGKFRYGIFT